MLVMNWSKEQRELVLERIQTFFAEERGEEIGSIAADQLLSFMVQAIGPHVYNQAVADARGVVNERMAAMEDELYSLEKPMSRR